MGLPNAHLSQVGSNTKSAVTTFCKSLRVGDVWHRNLEGSPPRMPSTSEQVALNINIHKINIMCSGLLENKTKTGECQKTEIPEEIGKMQMWQILLLKSQ